MFFRQFLKLNLEIYRSLYRSFISNKNKSKDYVLYINAPFILNILNIVAK